MPVPIVNEGAFDATIRNQVNLNFQQAMGLTTGNIYYLDPLNGSDNNSGLYPTQAFASLSAGYAALRSGKNDVLALIGNGATTSTARISSNFAWSKSAAHLVGVSTPTYFSQRSRIAPVSGATAFANFFTVTGSDCLFQNIEWFDGFNTGTTAQIAVTLSASNRCVFQSCHIAGMGDAASAADAGSRSLLISDGGEHVFRNCAIGLDTITRTNANSSVEVAAGTARNVFEDCIFPMLSGDGANFFLLSASAASFDRFVMFKRCNFVSAVGSTGTATAAAFKAVASSGGIIVFDSGSGLFGCTAIGDATTKGQTYVSGGTATNGVKGIVAS